MVEILVHPPDYVRKRTPKEARTFGCVIHVLVPDVVSVQAVLFYLGFDDEVDQNILTGAGATVRGCGNGAVVVIVSVGLFFFFFFFF